MCQSARTPAPSHCELCNRVVENLTIHHLVPRSTVEGREKRTLPTARLCSPCHKQLHTLFSNRDLKARYPSIDDLQRAPEMQKFLRWVRKQDANKRVKVKR